VFILSLTRVSVYQYSSTVLFNFNILILPNVSVTLMVYFARNFVFDVHIAFLSCSTFHSLVSFLYMDVTLLCFAQLHYSVNEILLNIVLPKS
jgi:hypothetical protein